VAPPRLPQDWQHLPRRGVLQREDPPGPGSSACTRAGHGVGEVRRVGARPPPLHAAGFGIGTACMPPSQAARDLGRLIERQYAESDSRRSCRVPSGSGGHPGRSA